MADKYTINGREVSLGQNDFVAAGGQGSVFVKGNTAYKIYTDLKHMIPVGKITELSTLNEKYIVKPEAVILDKKNKPVGYTMNAIGAGNYSLCQLFPKAFRTRNNLTEKVAFELVKRFQSGVKFVHSKDILIVDVNELNFMVSNNFDEVYFLDVDSYQTKSYPATALMESVRDRHSKKFSKETDWFSWAIVSFQLFVGIHPYKGIYDAFDNVPKDQKLDQRMLKNISVFHKDVRVPAVVLPFSVIPDSYKQWYEAVFEKGLRAAPPEGTHLVLVAPSIQRVQGQIGSSIFDISEVFSFTDDVSTFFNDYVVAGNSVYKGSKLVSDKVTPDTKIGLTPKTSTPIGTRIDRGTLEIKNLNTGLLFGTNVLGEALMAYNGHLYVKYGMNILELQFMELGGKVILTTRPVANVMPKATQLFDGVAITNMLGRHYAVIMPESGKSYQPSLKELDGYQILDAKFHRGVLVLTGVKNGKYDNFIYRFDSDFRDYDVRTHQDLSTPGINFTVLENGLCMYMHANDDLELFSNRPHSQNMKVVNDPAVRADVKLTSEGAQAMFIRGNKVYKFTMKGNK